MQKYIHLVQIMETEKVAANQLRTQLEDQDTEIERLKAEVSSIFIGSVKGCQVPEQFTLQNPLIRNENKPNFSIVLDDYLDDFS